MFRPGYQGLGTLFLRVNKQNLNQQALSFKMIPRTACHPWGAANLEKSWYGHQTIRSSPRKQYSTYPFRSFRLFRWFSFRPFRFVHALQNCAAIDLLRPAYLCGSRIRQRSSVMPPPKLRLAKAPLSAEWRVLGG